MVKIKNLVVKDAFWQILWRFISAVLGIVVVMMLSQYLWPYRFGDYTNIIDVFAIWWALADFGLYTLTLRVLWPLKEAWKTEELQREYSKFLFTRLVSITVVYAIVLLIAYQIPAYTANPYLVWWLPIGMLFSAVFMASSMIQLPLQLFWQMKKVTIALTFARIAQLVVLVVLLYWFVPGLWWNEMSVWIFVAIVWSILVSGLAQLAYTRSQTRKYLAVSIVPDWHFTWNITKSNAAYWLAYFLSSMHTLAISVIIWIIFPTIAGFPEQWIRKLPLGIMVVLIIIPSSIWNSMIHKIAWEETDVQRSSIGHLITLMVAVWSLVIAAALAFAPQIIWIIWWADYLSTWTTLGSDFLLPWLWLVLLGSFIKQCFNYLFLAIKKQNVLLWINGLGILIWLPFAYWAIREWWLLWALWWQWALELLFVVWSFFVAHKFKAFPLFDKKNLLWVLLASFVSLWLALTIHVTIPSHDRYWSIPLWFGLLGVFVFFAWKSLRSTLRWLG